MRLTLRLKDDNYLDVKVNIADRTLTIVSPIPSLSLDELLKISDEFHYKIVLPITGEIITPEVLKLTDEENEQYSIETNSALRLLLGLCNCAISEY